MPKAPPVGGKVKPASDELSLDELEVPIPENEIDSIIPNANLNDAQP